MAFLVMRRKFPSYAQTVCHAANQRSPARGFAAIQSGRSSNTNIPSFNPMKSILTLIAVATMAMFSSTLTAGEACKKCCKDACAACCKDKGKKCGKDCCKGE